MVMFFFFFQAEDGIRDGTVTGVQTCALPIWLLLLHRRDDFVDRGWPPAMHRRAQRLGRQIETELRAFTRRLCGREDPRKVRVVAYAVVEAPFAAIRRHVAARESPPPYVDVLIRTTYEAVIGLLG